MRKTETPKQDKPPAGWPFPTYKGVPFKPAPKPRAPKPVYEEAPF